MSGLFCLLCKENISGQSEREYFCIKCSGQIDSDEAFCGLHEKGTFWNNWTRIISMYLFHVPFLSNYKKKNGVLGVANVLGQINIR